MSADIYDLAVFLRPEHFDGGAAHQQRTADVDRLHLVPQINIDLVEGLGFQVAEYGGVVDKDM